MTEQWIAEEDMPTMPRGWYWATFPGTWIWYCPKRNAARSIDHGDLNWHPLMSKSYFGPWRIPENPYERKTTH